MSTRDTNKFPLRHGVYEINQKLALECVIGARVRLELQEEQTLQQLTHELARSPAAVSAIANVASALKRPIQDLSSIELERSLRST